MRGLDGEPLAARLVAERDLLVGGDVAQRDKLDDALGTAAVHARVGLRRVVVQRAKAEHNACEWLVE